MDMTIIERKIFALKSVASYSLFPSNVHYSIHTLTQQCYEFDYSKIISTKTNFIYF